MSSDVGLLITLAISAAVALESLTNRDRRALLGVPLVAIAVALWAGGEFMLRHAADPAESLFARRILWLGLCAAGPVWLWTAMQLHGAPRLRSARALLACAVSIELVVYASLYVSPELLVVGPAGAITRGPFFAVNVSVQWATALSAVGILLATAKRLRGPGRVAAACLVGALVLPLGANLFYLAFGVPTHDPTPVLLGLSGVVIRFAVLDLVGAPYLASNARSELLEQMDGGVLVADGSGTVIEANRAARELLVGADPVGRPIHEVVAPFDRDLGIDVRRFPLHRHRVVVGAGVLLTDRRAARAAEQRAEAASRLEGLGVLAAGVAHEVNSPLAVILGSTAALMEGLRDPADIELSEVRDWVENIDRSAESISDIVRQMGDLARFDGDAQHAEACDGKRVFERAIALSRFGKEAGDVDLARAAGDTWVTARETDLTQILLYLLVGSLRASHGIEHVEAMIEGDEDERIFRVRDRTTVLPDTPSRIFDPFHTGAGRIGLSLAWELARQNGGRLEASPRPGGGAEFRLTLPAAEAPLGRSG